MGIRIPFWEERRKKLPEDRLFLGHRDFKGCLNVWISNRQNPKDIWAFDIYKLGKEMPKNNYEISTLENMDWSKTPQTLQNPNRSYNVYCPHEFIWYRI